MNKLFDIVWYQSEHAEKAIRSLAVLSDEERAKRTNRHCFRMYRNSAMPTVSGKHVGKGYCVLTDRMGSEWLQPGQTEDGRVLIADYCELVEVEPGFIGGYFKPELWTLPELVASAKARVLKEEKDAAIIAKIREEKTTAWNEAVTKAEDSYFRTAARLVLLKGRVEPSALEPDELRRIVLMGHLSGVELPDLSIWTAIAMKDIENPDVESEPKPYDPLTFLEYAEQMAGLGRR